MLINKMNIRSFKPALNKDLFVKTNKLMMMHTALLSNIIYEHKGEMTSVCPSTKKEHISHLQNLQIFSQM